MEKQRSIDVSSIEWWKTCNSPRSGVFVGRIYEYLQYRKFLKDSFHELQKAQPNLSLRAFCKKAGFASTGTFRFITLGKRNLSPKSIKKIVKALSLTRQEESFFKLLVDFDQAKDSIQKSQAYEAILSFKPYQGARPLEKEQYYYYSSWLIPTIRELIGLAGLKEDPEWIAKQIIEPTKVSDVKTAIQMLLNLGLIVRDPQTKKLRQADAKVSSPELVRGICYSSYYRAVSELALSSIERTSSRHRELSALTVTLNQDRFESFKEDLIKFRNEMFEKYGEASASDDRVYQLNLHFFPLTKPLND